MSFLQMKIYNLVLNCMNMKPTHPVPSEGPAPYLTIKVNQRSSCFAIILAARKIFVLFVLPLTDRYPLSYLDVFDILSRIWVGNILNWGCCKILFNRMRGFILFNNQKGSWDKWILPFTDFIISSAPSPFIIIFSKKKNLQILLLFNQL